MTNGHQPISSIPDLNQHPSEWFGLTKREYFAAMAMQGHFSNGNLDTNAKDVAIWAVEAADALINELNK